MAMAAAPISRPTDRHSGSDITTPGTAQAATAQPAAVRTNVVPISHRLMRQSECQIGMAILGIRSGFQFVAERSFDDCEARQVPNQFLVTIQFNLSGAKCLN